MQLLKNVLNLLKENKNELQIIKLMVLIIINTWLLIIFWKILLIENINVIGNNVALTKMQTIAQPLLMYLGLDVLSPSMIKMLIVTTIILTSNLMILHFQGMVTMLITAILARYGYKSYTNYLINSENISMQPTIQPIITPEITSKVTEQAPIIINTGASSGINWWLWGTVIVIGVIALGAAGFAFWSHQTNATNIVETSNASLNLSRSLDAKITLIDQKATHINNQVDLLFTNHGKALDSLKNTDTLLHEKINNLEEGFQDFGTKSMKLEANNLENTKLLASQTLEISKEAKEFFGNVIESNNATEALIVTIAKIYDGFTILEENQNVISAKLESMTGTTTPRSSMFRPIVPSRLNNPTNINE